VSFLIAADQAFRNDQLTGTATQAIPERLCGRDAEIKKGLLFTGLTEFEI